MKPRLPAPAEADPHPVPTVSGVRFALQPGRHLVTVGLSGATVTSAASAVATTGLWRPLWALAAMGCLFLLVLWGLLLRASLRGLGRAHPGTPGTRR